MDTFKVRRADIRSILRATFPDYHGRKFTVDPSGRVTFSDLHWGGGTRNEYRAVMLYGLRVEPVPAGLPWESPTDGLAVDIPRGVLVVEHSYHCGVDCGIRVHCNPLDLRQMLPVAVRKSAAEASQEPKACSVDETSHYRAEG